MSTRQFKKLTIFLFICIFTICVNGISKEKAFEKEFEEKYQAWLKYCEKSNTDLNLASSLMYSIYHTGKEYNALINLGPKAVPYMIRKIENDSRGLFLQFAISDISKFKFYCEKDSKTNKDIFPDYPNLRERENIWIYWYYEGYKLTPQLFKNFYSQYLKYKSKDDPESQQKARHSYCVGDRMSQQNGHYFYLKIQGLGIQIIPLIIETAKKGDDDLLKLLPGLTDYNISDEKLSKIKSREERVKYCEEWWEANKEDWTIPFGD